MLSTIVFSKNRACQLDLLLRNLNLPATILYTYDLGFKTGYDKLISMYPQFAFVKETNFKEQLIELLQKDYIMFLVDDDICLERFDINCEELKHLKYNKKILCLSLRLSSTLDKVPLFFPGNLWRWGNHHHSWGYPMSVSSTIFRKKDILPIIQNIKFNNPCELELNLRKQPPRKRYMSCCDKQYFINNLANKVNHQFKFKNLGISLEWLEEQFISGKRISYDKIKEKALIKKDCFMMENYELE